MNKKEMKNNFYLNLTISTFFGYGVYYMYLATDFWNWFDVPISLLASASCQSALTIYDLMSRSKIK